MWHRIEEVVDEVELSAVLGNLAFIQTSKTLPYKRDWE